MVWILDGCWSSNSSGYFGLLPACREQGPSSENNEFLQRHNSRWCCLKLDLIKTLPCSFPHSLISDFIFFILLLFLFFFICFLCVTTRSLLAYQLCGAVQGRSQDKEFKEALSSRRLGKGNRGQALFRKPCTNSGLESLAVSIGEIRAASMKPFLFFFFFLAFPPLPFCARFPRMP